MGLVGDSSLYTYLIFFIVTLGFCALFSFLETSITALRLFKLKELAASTTGYATLFQSLEKNQNRVLTTILIANNLANVTAATVSTLFMDKLFVNFPPTVGFVCGIVITTASILVFEIIPKNIAKAHGEKYFQSTLWITNIIFYALYPFVTICMKLGDYFIYQFGKGHGHEASDYITSEKEIQFLIDYINEKGLMEQEKTAMLKSVFELGTTPVKEIMVPATTVVSINVETSLQDALAIFGQYQFSRFPVYDTKTDNIVGMLHQKDLFMAFLRNDKPTLRSLLRPIMFIPESIKVNQLLREFKEQHMHIAMVLNEYGGVIGLVTLEDVLEEIVGEIRDEYEAVTEKVIPLKPGGWLVDASIELEELGKLLTIVFESEDAQTLGGFLTERLQHLPKKGERILYKNYYFQVQQASQTKVTQVLVFAGTMPELFE